MDTPLIIQYTNLLHKYRDIEAKEVRKFVEQHKEDKVFVRRAKTLDGLFVLKRDLIDT